MRDARIVVDTVGIIKWFAVIQEGGRDIPVLLMWTAFLISALYGTYNWIGMLRRQKTHPKEASDG